MSEIERIKRRASEKIKQYESAIESIDKIAEILDADCITGIYDGRIALQFPFDIYKMEETKAKLASIGYKQASQWDVMLDNVKSRCYHMENETLSSLQLSFDPTIQGSTCNIIEVGSREVPIYQFECK